MTRVLLVDDRSENLEYLSAVFKNGGFEVEMTYQGEEALANARQHPPDAIISDLLMPVMDGYTLLRHWRADPVLRTIPFLVYTATYTEPQDQQLAHELGADAFMLKPLEPAILLQRLREVMSRSGAARVYPLSGTNDEETVLLKHYNEALIRKLEQKTQQLESSNRELLQEIFERGEIAQTQIAILNALPAHIALLDAAGVIITVNASWRSYAAANGLISPDFGVGQNYLVVCDRATRSGDRDAIDIVAGVRAVLHGEAAVFVHEYPCHSPTERRWFRMIVTPLHKYRSSGAVVMHIDVSDRKGVEQRLIDSQAQYLLLLNSTAEGIYGLDVDGRCTFCNPAAARLLGLQDPDELLGRQVHEQHHHSRADGRAVPLGDCRVHGAFRDGSDTHGEDEVFFRKDGTQFPVEYWSHPIRRGAEVIGAVNTFLDISERRSLEAQFLQAQKMEALGRFAGGVAHDFNNAIQVVLTCSELLDELLIGRELEQEYIREIQAAGKQGASLTRHLLAFSRKQLIRPALLDLNFVVGEIQPMLRRMMGANVTLATALDLSLCAIEADAGQIEQILMNLAANARDAMPGGGELVIRTSTTDRGEEVPHRHPRVPPGRYAVLSVSDTGSGMDSDTLARVFEPFFTTKGADKGTGLGLSTVYGIVKQSGGHIEIDSKPDGGTAFHIYFPAATVANTPTLRAEQPDRRSGGTESVLLVEDERALLSLVSATLRANGYDVTEASTGHAGIAYGNALDAKIDLLITDVILPDLSGPQVAEQILKMHPLMKVLYISGYTDDHMPQSNSAEALLLEKPFTVAALLTKIRQALDPRR
jgi:PAS domain S-box-containing protein